MKKITSNNISESCSKCSESHPLKSEIENLKQRLIDRNIAIVQMEANMSQELLPYSQGQLATLRATCESWQDKYDRLLEAHKRIQRVNQGLEDKLLRLVDRSESEKAKLAQDSINLTTALTTAAQAINRLKSENARYQNDLGIAVQLLQCNSSQYTNQKLNMLPHDLHQKVKSRLTPDMLKPQKPKLEPRVIRVPIPTFPPTAMVYSVNTCAEDKEENENEVDMVSAAIMAAILEEREKEKSQRHCPTCTCKLPFESNKPNNSSLNRGCDTMGCSKDFRSIHDIPRDSRNDSSFDNASLIGHNVNILGVNAIDVGTQTIPSYIGETGKVSSTCIYCQSSKALGEKGILCLDSSSESVDYSSNSYPQSFVENKDGLSKQNFNREKLECKQHLSWDWHAESQDSGSPPTPTSLTSNSLSYESETSCFTSPQESPGRISLHSTCSISKTQDEKVTNNVDIANTKTRENKLIPSCNTSTNKYSKIQMGKCLAQSVPISRVDKLPSSMNFYSNNKMPSYSDQGSFAIPIHLSPPLRRSVNETETNIWDPSIMTSQGSYKNIQSLSGSEENHILDCDTKVLNNSSYIKSPATSQQKAPPLCNNDDKQSFYDDTMKSIDIVISSLKGTSLEDFSFDISNPKSSPVIISSTFTRSATETTL